jgi:hypothetical protein
MLKVWVNEFGPRTLAGGKLALRSAVFQSNPAIMRKLDNVFKKVQENLCILGVDKSKKVWFNGFVQYLHNKIARLSGDCRLI